MPCHKCLGEPVAMRESDGSCGSCGDQVEIPTTPNEDKLRAFLKETSKADGGLAEYGAAARSGRGFEWVLKTEDFPEGSDAHSIVKKAFGGTIAMRKVRVSQSGRMVLGLLAEGGYIWRRHVDSTRFGYSYLRGGVEKRLDKKVVTNLIRQGLLGPALSGHLQLSEAGKLEAGA